MKGFVIFSFCISCTDPPAALVSCRVTVIMNLIKGKSFVAFLHLQKITTVLAPH